MAVKILKGKDSYLQQQARNAFKQYTPALSADSTTTLKTSLNGLVNHDPELIDWYDANKDKLRYDPSTKKYLLESDGTPGPLPSGLPASGTNISQSPNTNPTGDKKVFLAFPSTTASMIATVYAKIVGKGISFTDASLKSLPMSIESSGPISTADALQKIEEAFRTAGIQITNAADGSLLFTSTGKPEPAPGASAITTNSASSLSAVPHLP